MMTKNDYLNLAHKKINHKWIKLNLEKLKMVVGLDVGLFKVKDLMDKMLVGRFMGKFMKGESLHSCLMEVWHLVLVYKHIFHVLV